MKNLYDDPEFIERTAIPESIRMIERSQRNVDETTDMIRHNWFIGGDYFDLGKEYCIIDEYEKAHEAFRKAVEHAAEWIRIMEKGPMDPKNPRTYILSNEVERIVFYLVFNGDLDTLQHYCGRFVELEFAHPNRDWYWTYQKNRVYCKLALGRVDLDAELEYLSSKEKRLPGDLDYPRGVPGVARGISGMDGEAFHEGLEAMLAKYHRGYRRMEEYPLCPDACVAFSLARINGMDIEITDVGSEYHSLIPKYIRNMDWDPRSR